MITKKIKELETLYKGKNKVEKHTNISNPISGNGTKHNTSFFNKILDKLEIK